MFAFAIVTGICLLSVLVSFVAFRRGYTRSADDYFVAGSSLGYFVLIFSMLASFLSAFCMFGMSSFGYRTGFGSMFVLTVNLVPLGFLWYFMHRKTFMLGRARRWMSMGAPFGERYGPAMRAIVPSVVLIATLPYLVAQLQGIAMITDVMSQGRIPYWLGLFFVPAFIVLYLIMGGMKGTAWVNTAQGVFFTVMVFVLFLAVMAKNGGFGATMDEVFRQHPKLFELSEAGWSYPKLFGFAAAMCLGCICFPQPYMHAYSSRTAKGFKAMIFVFGGLCLVVIALPIMIGVATRLIEPGLTSKVDTDKVYGFAAFASLPDWIAALTIAGGFTAAMSTVNSVVFGNATNIANDIFKLIKPDATPRAMVTFARGCVAAIMTVCVLIAWKPKIPVAELSVMAFGLAAVAVFPLWGAYYWRRATGAGAIAAMVVGVGSNFAIFFWDSAKVLAPIKQAGGLNGFLVSFIAAGIAFFAVSLVTRPGEYETKSLKLFFHPSLDG